MYTTVIPEHLQPVIDAIDQMGELVTGNELAAALAVTRRTVNILATRGVLPPPVRPGNRYKPALWRRDEVRARVIERY